MINAGVASASAGAAAAGAHVVSMQLAMAMIHNVFFMRWNLINSGLNVRGFPFFH
jgi:hypothetical protein